MGLSVAAYARQLHQLLPPGAAWQTEPGSRLKALLLGIAEELARVDGRAMALIDESDPRTTLELLVEWERVLGLPDPCVPGEQSIAQRRIAAAARFTALGGQRAAYYIAVALALGYDITVSEFTPHDVDDDVEVPLVGEAWAYVWQVNAPTNSVGELTVEDTVEDPLAWWGNAALECVVSRLKPAHTHVIFAYA
ncbi:MAG: YmfQ family protein [Vicinamibacterales bacterium]